MVGLMAKVRRVPAPVSADKVFMVTLSIVLRRHTEPPSEKITKDCIKTYLAPPLERAS